MTDRYWNHQQPPMMAPGGAGGMLKRPHMEYDIPPTELSSGHEMCDYYPRDGDHGVPQSVKDTKTIGSAYDRYLQSALPSQTSREANTHGGDQGGRAFGGAPGIPTTEPSLMSRPSSAGTEMVSNGRDINFNRRPAGDTITRPVRETMPLPVRETMPLPRDASDTLYIEGLPSDCSKREVAHIFCPFVGYKEVILVPKGSKQRSGDPIILGFVDFVNPACAATAMSALQGYRVDEHDPASIFLRLQFSRNPGPRSAGQPPRGRR